MAAKAKIQIEIDQKDLEKIQELLEQNYTLRFAIANHYCNARIVGHGQGEEVRALSD